MSYEVTNHFESESVQKTVSLVWCELVAVEVDYESISMLVNIGITIHILGANL